MRKIIFRGKRKDNNVWVSGFYSYLFDEKANDYKYEIVFQHMESADMSYPYPSCHTICAEVIPETVGQFTGLTESYERTKSFEPKEIYQHDILEMEYEGKKIICFVEFEICGFILVSNDFEDGYIWIADVEEHDADECSWIPFSRIIGNIHDNPKSLK